MKDYVGLVEKYEAWLAEPAQQRLASQEDTSAEALILIDDLSVSQRTWLSSFIADWEDAQQ